MSTFEGYPAMCGRLRGRVIAAIIHLDCADPVSALATLKRALAESDAQIAMQEAELDQKQARLFGQGQRIPMFDKTQPTQGE